MSFPAAKKARADRRTYWAARTRHPKKPDHPFAHTERFRRQDAELLKAQYLVYDDEAKLVQTTKEALADLDKLYEADAEPQAREARERNPDTPLTSAD